MQELTQYERDSLNKLGQSIQSGKWSNTGLVQLIELAGMYLNIKTIPDYAKDQQITYNGAKKRINPITIFNVKFIIDNL